MKADCTSFNILKGYRVLIYESSRKRVLSILFFPLWYGFKKIHFVSTTYWLQHINWSDYHLRSQKDGKCDISQFLNALSRFSHEYHVNKLKKCDIRLFTQYTYDMYCSNEMHRPETFSSYHVHTLLNHERYI